MNNTTNNIKINCFNCRGIRNAIKRNNIFNWLKTSHYGICLLQETHSVEADELKWEQEWGGQIFYSHGEFNARGTAILIPSKICENFEYLNGHKDESGRLIIMNCKIEECKFTLMNLYCPTKDNHKAQCEFLKSVVNLIEEYGSENLIIGGDLNTYLDISMDKKGGNLEKSSKYAENINAFCEEYALADLWRVRNPDKRSYTRRENSRNGIIQSRLDYWLVSIGLSYLIKNVKISPGNSSDHSLISFNIDLTNTQRRGKGFWKFNNSLLTDTEYISMIKDVIANIPIELETDNKNTLWEFAKCRIRTETMVYSSMKAKKTREKQTMLENKIKELEQELTEKYIHTSYLNYVQCKSEWENILMIKSNGIKLRSKAKWIEDGEKNTKYFLNLEKRNYNSKYIKKLINSQGEELTDVKSIINEQSEFYQKLYSTHLNDNSKTKEISNEFLDSEHIPKLNNADQELCDQELSIHDCGKALKDLANNKSPGSDGLTTNFYKFFWPDIRNMVHNSYLYSLENKLLSQEQKLGIINLIPKKDKDLRYLKNWRPVSLLNTDYKILAKSLANRLHKVIKKLIDPDQVGYIKDRYIGESVRKLFDILSYTDENEIEAILAQVDFEKAFDSIEWPFLFDTLKAFNFGDEIISWIKILYTDISSCVGNNGYYSKFFKLSRSIRQGCPISALLFILVAEIIAIRIRSDPKIKGVKINNTEVKISLMADDTTLFISDIASLVQAISNFNKFNICSGLKLNIDKTEIIPLGKLRGKITSLPIDINGIKINNGPFKALGVWYSHDENEVYTLNLIDRIKNMNKLINIWKARSLSLRGKVTIIRNLILPQIQFLFSMVYIPDNILKEIDNLLFQYLWDNKPPKIKKNTIIAPVKEGGLNMVDVYAVHTAAKCGWLKRLLNGSTDIAWKKIMLLKLNISTEMLNRNIIYSKFTCCTSPFHIQILKSWNELHNKSELNKTAEILDQNLLYNQLIKIDNKHVTGNYLGNNNAHLKTLKIKDIIDKNGKILNSIQAGEQLGIRLNTWNWNILVTAIPKTWRQKITKDTDLPKITQSLETKEINITINNTTKNFKSVSTKQIYQQLLLKRISPATSIEKWIEIFPFMEGIEWNKIFQLPYTITKETYLHSFQYKILNRIINCNHKLFIWKIKDHNKCDYCNSIDTLEHHLFWCKRTQEFWQKTRDWARNNLDTSMQLTICEIIFGITITGNSSINTINFLILTGKLFINKSRTNKQPLYFINFLAFVKEKIKHSTYLRQINDQLVEDWERDLMDAL